MSQSLFIQDRAQEKKTTIKDLGHQDLQNNSSGRRSPEKWVEGEERGDELGRRGKEMSGEQWNEKQEKESNGRDRQGKKGKPRTL